MFRGETIDIVIKGDSVLNLDSNDFMVLLYPDRHPETVFSVSKSEMKKQNSNYYTGSIDFETTKTMPLGMYTIEVLFINGTSSRSVFAKQGAFPLYDSASKSIN